MSRRTWTTIVPTLAAFAATMSLALCATAADDWTLRRVMLSTGGVGYFEYEATVTGDADLSLSVRLDQVSDVLKSVIVYDDRGSIGKISLPGPDPLHEAFRDLPFGQDALDSPVALLTALRGAEVRVQAPRGIVKGRIVSVTPELIHKDDETMTRHRLTVMSDAGLLQVILEDVGAVEIVDPALRQSVQTALTALARLQGGERRELSIHVAGQGQRLVRVGYVVEAPLWKTSYHLVLSSEASATTADLWGWAILENQSGRDWQNVDLTVASGNPVTFRQALYEAYYVNRPEVPVEVLGRVLPPPDLGAITPPGPVPPETRGGAHGFADLAAEMPAEAAPLAPPEATESVTQVVVHFPEPVTVANGESLLLPVITDKIPATRVSHYQPGTEKLHPIASVRLTNNRDTGLPPGALTLYERAKSTGTVTYLGDARLSPLPPGQERLIDFAVDQKVRIDREETEARIVATASIVNGVLEISIKDRKTTRYTIAGAAGEDRVVLLEHPRIAGYELVERATGNIQLTPDSYRISVPVPAGSTVALDVTLEKPLAEHYALSDLNNDRIAYYLATPRISDTVRATLNELSALRAVVAERQADLDRLTHDLEASQAEQARIRDNLKAVPDGSELYQRYLAKLGQEEDRIEALRAKIEAAQRAIEESRKALADFISGLNR